MTAQAGLRPGREPPGGPPSGRPQHRRRIGGRSAADVLDQAAERIVGQLPHPGREPDDEHAVVHVALAERRCQLRGGVGRQLGGTLTTQRHRYPVRDVYVGALVHYDENGEVVEVARFRTP